MVRALKARRHPITARNADGVPSLAIREVLSVFEGLSAPRCDPQQSEVMTEEFEKDVALVVSGGRTGTTFLGRSVSEIVPRAVSVHEPDVWPGLTGEALSRIREFGLRHMVIDRLRGKSGMRHLSLQRLRGEISVDEAAAEIRRQRADYYRSMPEPLVVESNYQAFGVLPAFRKGFAEAKIIGLVRHPTTWVASQLDYGTRRGSRDRLQAWGQTRVRPEMIGDEFDARWDEMSRVERLCWDWLAINRSLVRAAERDPTIRIFRYEDLFLADDRESNFRRFLDFLTDFEDHSYHYSLSARDLESRINPRPNRETSSEAEGARFHRAVREICGDLMPAFGYEPDGTES